ncbi:MAG TPA: TonB family protein [Candidatus Baltobacteraceae bacterium]|nr:TonB family protein [Candidatus Baltobacteraceae bacterium]
MKRVTIGVLICAAFFFCAHRPASAALEYCPARLDARAVGQSVPSKNPAALYGFELTGLAPRTIATATLAFDTSAGWYTVDVPSVALVEKDRHYSAPWVDFIRHDYVSPVMYVRFPQPLTIAHGWVSSAVTGDDGTGWQAGQTVTCDPIAMASPDQMKNAQAAHLTYRRQYTLDPKDGDHLSDSPSANSLVLTPRPAQALESSNCAEPFLAATLQHQEQPQYPHVAVDMATSTSVEIALDPDGTVRDAWVWAPSGVPQFDQEALRAAKASTYTGARAYCQPVPAEYLFVVTFKPN